MKVFELAKELDIRSLDLVDQLKEKGFSIKNHMSSLTDEDVLKIKKLYEIKEDIIPVKKIVKKKKEVISVESEVKTSRKKIIRKTQDKEEEIQEVLPPVKEFLEEKKNEEIEEPIAPQFELEEPEKTIKEEKVEIFKEKMHSFTPIFVPKEEEELIVQDKESLVKNTAVVDPLHKKVVKVKDVAQIKADEELKFATTIVGRSIYTPIKKKNIYLGPSKKNTLTERKDSKKNIKIDGAISALDFAQQLSLSFDDFAAQVTKLNLLIKKEDFFGFILAEKIGKLFDYNVEEISLKVENFVEEGKNLKPRSPIVTVMGHVDHGKTTLLDFLRKTRVVDKEAGGITQHIGAYQVYYHNQPFTFLDTPGHAAFSSMRERGAKVTDIVILVVAADDGLMPQTIEAIKVIQESKVEVIVAINKIDKEGADPSRVKQALLEYNLVAEEWGGQTQMVEISALKGLNIDKLMEAIQLQTEMMDLKASFEGFAKGMIIESHLETGKGVVTTAIVQSGVLRVGDVIFSNDQYGKVRLLVNDVNKTLKEATVSMPIQILGFSQVTQPGELFQVLPSEKEAKILVENSLREKKELEGLKKKTTLEDFFAAHDSTEKKIMNLIIKCDVQGSFEAIKQSLENLGNEEVALKILTGGVGAISDSDVLMAKNSNAYIIGFNMRPTTSAKKLADEKGVDIKTYSIIYELIQDVTLALQGLLSPVFEEKYLGRAEVRKVFKLPKVIVAGCLVVDGKLERSASIRILRDEKILHEGKIASLKRFKDDVKEVRLNQDCGISIESYQDLQEGDVFEFFTKEKKTKLL